VLSRDYQKRLGQTAWAKVHKTNYLIGYDDKVTTGSRDYCWRFFPDGLVALGIGYAPDSNHNISWRP